MTGLLLLGLWLFLDDFEWSLLHVVERVHWLLTRLDPWQLDFHTVHLLLLVGIPTFGCLIFTSHGSIGLLYGRGSNMELGLRQRHVSNFGFGLR